MQAGAAVTPLIFLDRDPVHPPLQITQENARDLCTFCFLEVGVISLPISFGMSAYIPALVTNRLQTERVTEQKLVVWAKVSPAHPRNSSRRCTYNLMRLAVPFVCLSSLIFATYASAMIPSRRGPISPQYVSLWKLEARARALEASRSAKTSPLVLQDSTPCFVPEPPDPQQHRPDHLEFPEQFFE